MSFKGSRPGKIKGRIKHLSSFVLIWSIVFQIGLGTTAATVYAKASDPAEFVAIKPEAMPESLRQATEGPEGDEVLKKVISKLSAEISSHPLINLSDFGSANRVFYKGVVYQEGGLQDLVEAGELYDESPAIEKQLKFDRLNLDLVPLALKQFDQEFEVIADSKHKRFHLFYRKNLGTSSDGKPLYELRESYSLYDIEIAGTPVVTKNWIFYVVKENGIPSRVEAISIPEFKTKAMSSDVPRYVALDFKDWANPEQITGIEVLLEKNGPQRLKASSEDSQLPRIINEGDIAIKMGNEMVWVPLERMLAGIRDWQQEFAYVIQAVDPKFARSQGVTEFLQKEDKENFTRNVQLATKRVEFLNESNPGTSSALISYINNLPAKFIVNQFKSVDKLGQQVREAFPSDYSRQKEILEHMENAKKAGKPFASFEQARIDFIGKPYRESVQESEKALTRFQKFKKKFSVKKFLAFSTVASLITAYTLDHTIGTNFLSQMAEIGGKVLEKTTRIPLIGDFITEPIYNQLGGLQYGDQARKTVAGAATLILAYPATTTAISYVKRRNLKDLNKADAYNSGIQLFGKLGSSFQEPVVTSRYGLYQPNVYAARLQGFKAFENKDVLNAPWVTEEKIFENRKNITEARHDAAEADYAAEDLAAAAFLCTYGGDVSVGRFFMEQFAEHATVLELLREDSAFNVGDSEKPILKKNWPKYLAAAEEIVKKRGKLTRGEVYKNLDNFHVEIVNKIADGLITKKSVWQRVKNKVKSFGSAAVDIAVNFNGKQIKRNVEGMKLDPIGVEIAHNTGLIDYTASTIMYVPLVMQLVARLAIRAIVDSAYQIFVYITAAAYMSACDRIGGKGYSDEFVPSASSYIFQQGEEDKKVSSDLLFTKTQSFWEATKLIAKELADPNAGGPLKMWKAMISRTTNSVQSQVITFGLPLGLGYFFSNKYSTLWELTGATLFGSLSTILGKNAYDGYAGIAWAPVYFGMGVMQDTADENGKKMKKAFSQLHQNVNLDKENEKEWKAGVRVVKTLYQEGKVALPEHLNIPSANYTPELAQDLLVHFYKNPPLSNKANPTMTNLLNVGFGTVLSVVLYTLRVSSALFSKSATVAGMGLQVLSAIGKLWVTDATLGVVSEKVVPVALTSKYSPVHWAIRAIKATHQTCSEYLSPYFVEQVVVNVQ